MNRFDTQARLVFYYAREEARALHQSRVAPGHLLLGLLHSNGGARDVLEQMGARLGSLRSLYQQLSPLADRVQLTRQASFSPQIRRVIGSASREAQDLGTATTSSQHILLALMKLRNPVLRQMLDSIDPDLERIRGRARELEVVVEQVSLDQMPASLPEPTRAALAQLLMLAEQGGDAPATARSLMVGLLLKTGDQRMLPWLENVVYRWLTEDQVTEQEKRAVLHLLMSGALPGSQRLSED